MKNRQTYWNPFTRQYGFIERKNFHGRFEWFAIHDKQVNTHPSFGAAYDEIKQAGYEPMGFLDSTGVRRYTLPLDDLNSLYARFEDFVADCTKNEYDENKNAIKAVYTLIHKHIKYQAYKHINFEA